MFLFARLSGGRLEVVFWGEGDFVDGFGLSYFYFIIHEMGFNSLRMYRLYSDYIIKTDPIV